MRKLLIATLLVLATNGCGSSAGAAPSDLQKADIPTCQSPDGTVCAGVPGDKGDTGAQGIQGVAGPQGVQGQQGPQGSKGDTGPQGPQGVAGPQGLVGPQGPAGPQGVQGSAGPQGVQGTKGDQGIQGVAGPKGAAGTNGANGVNGMTTWVHGTVSGTTMNFGILMPLPAGGTGIYMRTPGNTVANFPSDWIIETSPSKFYYASNDCSGTAFVVASVFALKNQLYAMGGSKWGYVNGASQSLNYQSTSINGGCTSNSAANIGPSVPLADSGFSFSVNSSLPWTIFLQ